MKPATLLPPLAFLLVASAPLAAAQSKPAATSADLDFFERKVRPVLVESCGSCHSGAKTRGGLSLGSRAGALRGGDSGPAVVPGDPERSLLLKAVRHATAELKMPPKGKLSDAVVADLTTWVRRGAAWPDAPAPTGEAVIRANGTPITAADRAFWSFRPIADPALPAVKNASWPRRPLDRFILASLEAKGLHPVAQADRRALLRRVTFDLTGLPPAPEEVDAFVADTRPDAYERVIERLLSSPAYGERWGRFWLDVARYGEDQAHTFQARLYPHGWRYRDWVVSAFNSDLPYDRFVLDQIAVDLLDDPAHEQAALGFFGLGPVYYVDGSAKKEVEAAELDDRIDTLTRGFLALTVSCARCHDHKFDPIPTADYYSLAGVIRSSQYQVALLAPPDVVRRYSSAQERIKEQDGRIKTFLDAQTVCMAEGMVGESARYMVAAWKLSMARDKGSRLTTATVAAQEKLKAGTLDGWSRYLFGRGSATRAALAGWRKALSGLQAGKNLSRDPAALSAVTAAAQAFQKELEALLKERDALAKAGKKLPKDREDRLREVFSPQGPFKLNPQQVEAKLPSAERQTLGDMRKEATRLRRDSPPAPPMAHAIAEGTPADMHVYVRGNPRKEGEVAPRRFLRILAGDAPPAFHKGSGRLELARAIASKDNPLTARVMVNRVWQHHFGKGIVGTPSNFGMLGERPTHPELLDHLSSRFIASGWSIKALHRDILLSATYRLGCIHDEGNAAIDPANRLYWRMDRRRLNVEAWRDALLAATDDLDRTVGGPSTDLNNLNNRRRTLYGAVSRHNLSGLLRLFDFPDANLTSEKRPVTIVPLQQLFVLNSDFMVERARALARSLAAVEKDDEARIRLAIRRLYGRPARDWEVALGLELLKAPEEPGAKPGLTRWEEYAQVLLAANELMFLD
jgi:hypothetical protein